MAKFTDRLAHAFNVFFDRADKDEQLMYSRGESFQYAPSRIRVNSTSDRSIVSSLYMRLAIDVASETIKHVRLDENERYLETIKSGLNACLTVEANLDQGARAFRQDVAQSLFETGCIAIVPVETSLNPETTGSYDIITMRVGIIKQWYPRHIRVSVYNDINGRREEITIAKTSVAIVENPLYAVMNEPNSTLQRLIRKLTLLDSVDEASSSGKLDLIIQLPYVIKSDARRQQADQRAADIEAQLKGSAYGIAYTDGTEKITQLNRPAENNLMKQVEYLTSMLYSQLGITQAVFDGSADEKTMLNYYARTIDPILDAIIEAMKRSFLTKTARTQGQSIEYYRDPFKLVPISQMADIADKFSRNEILSSNEIRGSIGFAPSKDPKADQLVNSNMPDQTEAVAPTSTEETTEEESSPLLSDLLKQTETDAE